MEKKILFAVDGSEKGFKALSIVGDLVKDQSDVRLILFHCVQQLAGLSPGEVCTDVDESCKLPYATQEKVGNAVLDEAKRHLFATGFPKERVETKLKINSTDPAGDILAEANEANIETIAVGRRGRSQLETLLIGSVSGKVAQYAQHRTVWVVDTPVHASRKVMIAMEGASDADELTRYTSEFVASNPNLKFTFVHLMPPVPPTFWDDGHILGSAEQKDRESRIEKWRREWKERVDGLMAQARNKLVSKGVSESNIETFILPTKQGVARDLLNEIDEHEFQMVLMGKKSLRERKPFLMGSHANKILQNIKGAILCLVDN
ncbi:universal stress protein [Desulforhabdus amnigena]|jgi:nucleotide-binding universal stress UspA family protein|uniref:UspA domain-containing protein n=1 Tax=Desulforhabdus amnigena TaxID=40218 RepID=A0A9W6FVC5_9BACT|nr:universal stress protein [Desulforhabdus amnigena]NLJ28023.1 universal stress protein [Deltaproteobacteria bacterium]GLI35554.1 hypothetical protein DAMNIGENAA_29870 [Desulforhabdus amnigena]